MDDFSQKIILAVIAFVLGLVAEGVKRFFQSEKRSGCYTVNRRPILAMTDSLPTEVAQKLPASPLGNISEITVTMTNTGDLQLKDVNVLVVPKPGCELLDHKVTTIPEREVPHSPAEHPKPHELRIPSVTLERNQSVRAVLFLLSKDTPDVSVFVSGGGEKAEIPEGTDRLSGDLGPHIKQIILNYFLAEMVGGFCLGLGYLLGSVIPAGEEFSSKVQMSGAGIGHVLGAVMRLWFLLRIVPHALAVLQIVKGWRTVKT